MKRKAFTLVELLVVISIIALLLAVLMPALNKAKSQANRVVCKSNIRQYGLAGNMYLSSNDDLFPDPWQSIYDSCQGRCVGVCTNPAHQTFPGELQRYCRWHNAEYSLVDHPEYAGPFFKYLQNAKVNLCPTFKKLSRVRGSEHPAHIPFIPIEPQFGYSQNAYLGTSFFSGVLKSQEVKRPAETFFFSEENMWLINKSRQGGYYRENLSSAVLNDTALLARIYPKRDYTYDDCFATFHAAPSNNYNEGVANAVMLDGSVREVRPQDNGTFKLAWPR